MRFMVPLCGLCCTSAIQCWCVRYLNVFMVIFAKLLWYLRLKNQTYAEILEYSILHRFGFERGGCGDGRREWRAWVYRRKKKQVVGYLAESFFFVTGRFLLDFL